MKDDSSDRGLRPAPDSPPTSPETRERPGKASQGVGPAGEQVQGTSRQGVEVHYGASAPRWTARPLPRDSSTVGDEGGGPTS